MCPPADYETAYPRSLSVREREWLWWILPDDRTGYSAYRRFIESMVVIGEGRRGTGEMILGAHDAEPDFSAPLSPVFAYGAIETNFGEISITMREILDGQISVEIVNQRSEEVPQDFEESRRWTYSTWRSGDPCPRCGNPLREVMMHTATSEKFTLALCAADKRIWVNEVSTLVNHLIPVTNFYNELMLHKNIRDPKIALDARLLFPNLGKYSDADLTYAFLTYNTIKTKVRVVSPIRPDHPVKPSVVKRLANLLKRGRS